jgi:type IV pilus assembly protein PilF
MRKPFLVPLVPIVAALAFVRPEPALAQRTTAGIRGKVLDQAGQGIGGVEIEMVFEGESRVPVTKKQQTDKKGGYVRMGLPDGKWKITFSKEGYKTYIMETYLSLGGFSEQGDVILEPAPVAPPPTAGPPPEELRSTDEAEKEKVSAEYGAAVAAAQAGRYDEAEPAFKEILEKYPDLASAHFNLGYVYRMKKDWKGAEAEFQRVTELQPEKGDAFIALATVREMDGRGNEAAEGLLAAAPGFAEDAKFQYALGITCANAGRPTEAEAALRKTTELDPANAEAVYQLATILVGQAKTTEALALLEKYLGMTGQNSANVATAKALIAALQKK